MLRCLSTVNHRTPYRRVGKPNSEIRVKSVNSLLWLTKVRSVNSPTHVYFHNNKNLQSYRLQQHARLAQALSDRLTVDRVAYDVQTQDQTSVVRAGRLNIIHS